MKKTLLGISIALASVLSGCSTIGMVSYERLQAADVSFPDGVRRVGVVNAMPVFDFQKPASASDGLEGDGRVAAESLAQEIAATRYFDEVVICDSALCAERTLTDQPALSDGQADSLIHALGVDVLFAFERVNIRLKEGLLFIPELMTPVEAVDGVVTPIVRAYIAGRPSPLYVLSKSDTISWELTPSLELELIQKESSEYAGSMLVKHLLPYWEEHSRYYFDGGSVEMRDAGVYLREQNWEEAALLWQKVYDSKKGKARMRAAYNLALYYEMQDDYARAAEYLQVADSLAGEASQEKRLIEAYRLQLGTLEARNQQLKIQMRRFE